MVLNYERHMMKMSLVLLLFRCSTTTKT